MSAGKLLLFTREFITLLETKAILKPDGTFDQTKLDTLAENVEFVTAVIGLLHRYGMPVPAKMDQFLRALPFLVAMFD